MMPGACHRVVGFAGNTLECRKYETSHILRPAKCDDTTRVVPRIYHASHRDHIPPYAVRANAAANPEYDLRYRNDTEAGEFVRQCGQLVHQAYQCLQAPAYRADVFRFCALYVQGGVYLDSDIMLVTDMDRVYSPCSNVSMGYDFPWGGLSGKQMKILAGVPRAPIFRCMLDNIVQNVRYRLVTSSLALTGPALLHKCYQNHSKDVALTYLDTRGANWPYSGMRDHTNILAYEVPGRKEFGFSDEYDYNVFRVRKSVYATTCSLPFTRPPASYTSKVQRGNTNHHRVASSFFP